MELSKSEKYLKFEGLSLVQLHHSRTVVYLCTLNSVNLVYLVYYGLKVQALHESVCTQSFFMSVFSCIRTEYREIRSISPYLVQMRENTDQKNSEYGYFSRSSIYPPQLHKTDKKLSHEDFLWKRWYKNVAKLTRKNSIMESFWKSGGSLIHCRCFSF